MENHPIPQDITGFQFKLIGDMTVKQFAYLAAGVAIGWIIFVLPLIPIVKIPLAGISILLGVGFAFVPIEGRPMDLMISNFIKAIFYPTQFVYQKQGGHLWLPIPHLAQSQKQQRAQQEAQTASLSGQALKDYLNALPKRSKSQLDQKEMVFFESLAAIQTNPAPQLQMPQPMAPHAFANQIPPASVSPTQQTPAKKETELPSEEEEILRKEAQILQQQLAEAKAEETSKSGSEEYQQAHLKVLELENLLNDTTKQKQVLERQIAELQKKLANENKNVYSPSIAQAPKKETQNVRSIPQGLGKSIGLPISPEFPNLVTGIVKDPRGNPLANILVEIKDADGNPVRAFKTNPLGQFASATPINNGTYTIEFEDPKEENKFDIIQFSATGQIILPIEVISVDQREELRRSLFN
ncbi:MAG: PrgI family protein [Patescibacteria group bacterium]|nr:PrgI family protein [Patescibacteria group bacterium]